MMTRPAGCLFLLSVMSVLSPLSAQEPDLAAQMEKAIALLESSGTADSDPESLSMMLNACAEGYIQRGDFAKALERVQRSLDLCRKHGFDSMTSFFTASKILSQIDDEEATDFMIGELQAPGVAPAYKKGLLKALEMHLGLRGDPKLAVLASYELWQMHHAESPDSETEFWALFQYGNHCLANRIFDNAATALTGARDLALRIGKPELAANCSRSLATALLSAGDPEESLKLSQEAVEFRRAANDRLFLGYDLRSLAEVQLLLNRFADARKLLDEAGTFAQTDFEKGILGGLAASLLLKQSLVEAGQADYAAVIVAQEAAVAAKLKNTAAGEAFAKLGATNDFITLASFQILAGRLDAAEVTLREAEAGADAWEANSREAQKVAVFSADQVNLSMAEVRSGIHEVRQQIGVLRGDPVAALVAAENGRGAAQAALLRERLGLGPEERVVKTLTAEEIRDIATEHGGTLVVYSVVHPFANDTRRHFRAGEIAGAPSQLYLWVIGSDGTMEFRSVPLAAPLGELVRAALAAIREPGAAEGGGKDALALLSGLLLDPIREFLPKEAGSLVTFVPQGELFLVPFAALPFGDGGKTLLDQHTVTVTPSIELLRLAREQGRAVAEAGNSEVLLVGNPTMPGYQSRPDRSAEALSPLPGAEAEAKHLAGILGTSPLIGDAATETAVVERMGKARFLHFATHGLLEAESSFNQSLLSALAFAPGLGEDGFLTAKEVSRLKLRAELAVLSACDTGRGAITGDGVVGLSRGFISAGVPTLVVSLWPVSDEATAALMGHYYRAMKSGTGKAAALREAMLRTKEQFPEPVKWAPFVLYGLPGAEEGAE
jgi:tetratricopeptide (TPR) repeat protein